MNHTPTRRPRLSRGRPRSNLLAWLLAVSTLPVVAPASSGATATPTPPVAEHDHAAHHHDDDAPGSDGHNAHEGAEGLRLAATSGETVLAAGEACRGDDVRHYDVVALAVDLTLNRYLDHDPEARMFALASDVARVRAEERRNAEARADGSEPAVSIGLQGDAIQPLTLRVHAGDCLRITLRNDLEQPASIHVHGSALRLADDGSPALATNERAYAQPGERVEYEWAVPVNQPEGTHYFHSHGLDRTQTAHGLFGAVIVEPPGSVWIDPLSGEEAATGWQSVVAVPGGEAFREFVLYYHEIGNEKYQLLDAGDEFVPLVDPLTSAYRPAARALNYRSEPFLNRLRLQQERDGYVDESLEYSSYAFGDPATPVMRAYVGDRTKQRVVHAGSEVFHVHHVHGGSIRWPRQPGTESGLGRGLDKEPPLLPAVSERTDSQSMGPSETFDVVDECAAGGCQAAAGDFMYHCHVAHHYFAGMWGIWRVYNTEQNGAASTDGLPALGELPGAEDRVEPAVTSDRLIGREVDTGPRRVRVTAANLASVVEPQLPPRGVPRGYDASVLDWTLEGDRYLNEPETSDTWPGYRPEKPGERPPIRFDPATGRLAYPLLRPHLARRPPFAPGHGPAPFLDAYGAAAEPAGPGANGPASVCPSGTTPLKYAINAVPASVPVNADAGLVDANGMLFVLREQRDALADDPDLRAPLAIRANAREHCVDILLRNELSDGDETPFSKVGAHIHFMQFDVQGSDGVDVGFNYEQTVRPYRAEGTTLAAGAPAGESVLRVADASRWQPGVLLGVGLDQAETFEARTITAVDGNTVTLDAPLAFSHRAGEFAGTEFVRYRWFPDVQFGTAYFHDHVDALSTWRHGLFGAVVAEPPQSAWLDPYTAQPVASGAIADIITTRPVSVDVESSFRELVLFTPDESPVHHVGRSQGGELNRRAEPLDGRPGDPALAFSSSAHGDPVTPILEAHVGDPLVIRDLVAASNDVHTFHLDGHWFRVEPWNEHSPPRSTAHLGISERFDLVVPAAGGPQRLPGDYLYSSGRHVKLREGSWGIVRVVEGDESSLLPLPDGAPAQVARRDVCPDDAPVRRFAVSAVEAPLPMLGGDPGRVFVLDREVAAVTGGRRPPEPLVLHAGVGDCIDITLTNRLADTPVSLHADMLAYDPATSGGVAAGREPRQAVDPEGSRRFRFYASPEVGETVATLRDLANPMVNPALGLYGAVVVAGTGARFLDPESGADISDGASWRADVVLPDGTAYRDFTLLFHDEDDAIGTHRMPYTVDVRGAAAVNYASAPIDDESLLTAAGADGGPTTPVLEAVAGDDVRIHVLAPWSEQGQVFAVEGHSWMLEPGTEGGNRVSSMQIGGLEAVTVVPDGGAGGVESIPGDYVWGNHRLPYEHAGMWGLLRVVSRPGEAGLRRLPGSAGRNADTNWAMALGGGAIVAIGGFAVLRRRASRRRAPLPH